jgi:hypothetical protein
MAVERQAAKHTGVPRARSVRYAFALAALTGLFGARVLAQALQRWSPVASLPPFDDFQGSDLPYWILLSTQLLLLAWMMAVTRNVAAGRYPKPRTGRLLAWIGGIYMAGSVARIVVGLGVADAPAWFTAWISAVFHLVLAGFVLTLAAYHRWPRHAEAAR